jgi:hypothetical protein
MSNQMEEQILAYDGELALTWSMFWEELTELQITFTNTIPYEHLQLLIDKYCVCVSVEELAEDWENV